MKFRVVAAEILRVDSINDSAARPIPAALLAS
jgi:hypothetical protein